MALFTNLGNLQSNLFADGQPGANRQGNQVYPFGGEILSKIAGTNIKAHLAHLSNAFHSEQAHLPVGATIGMGIIDKTEVFPEDALSDNLFPDTFLIAAADGNYLHSLFSLYYRLY
jgi:hypothetical protein